MWKQRWRGLWPLPPLLFWENTTLIVGSPKWGRDFTRKIEPSPAQSLQRSAFPILSLFSAQVAANADDVNDMITMLGAAGIIKSVRAAGQALGHLSGSCFVDFIRYGHRFTSSRKDPAGFPGGARGFGAGGNAERVNMGPLYQREPQQPPPRPLEAGVVG
jgi:hypothetical protein